nr:16S rRNA (guanine(966)-N(2))-methyltransferase RsmD [Tissierella sp.]
MRVISGIRKGHKLKSPKGQLTRPTEDRIKESLFNILGILNKESIVLDLFSGSGSIGIEFLSRGAKEVYFIDSSLDSINTIRENLNHTRLLENSVVYKKDSLQAIRFLKDKSIKFDYIYIDPPFENHELIFNVLKNLGKHPILKENSMIIIEHEKKLNLSDNLSVFEIIDSRDYGSKAITFLKSPKEVIYESNISR